MARAIWTGSISFGLVNIPVRLYSATEQKDVHFHQFEEGTGKRVKNKRVAEGTDREVDYDDIVKGYEVEDGKFVMVTPEELESVEPGATRTIDIEDFVELAAIDPMYFEKTYYLGPEEGAGAQKAYGLLREAMSDAGLAAVAKFVMRSKQYLATLRTLDDLIVLETMYFPDEIRDPKGVENVPKKVELSARERKAARQLVDSLTREWEPDRYQDTYRERVLDLIERKAKGEDVVVEQPEREEADVVDLMAALEASLNARKPAKKPAAKKPAKKRAAKKTSKKTAKRKAS